MKKIFSFGIALMMMFASPLSSLAQTEMSADKLRVETAQLKKEKRKLFIRMLISTKRECQAQLGNNDEAVRNCFKQNVKENVLLHVRTLRDAKNECRKMHNNPQEIEYCQYSNYVAFAKGEPLVAMEAEVMTHEEDVEGYSEFRKTLQSHQEAWSDELMNAIPEVTDYERTKDTFEMNMMFDFPEEGIPEVNVQITSESEKDISNQQNPKVQSDISVSGNIEDVYTQMGFNVDIETILKDESFYFLLKEFGITSNQFPAEEINALFEPIEGQWYEDKLSDLSNNPEFEADIREAIATFHKSLLQQSKKPSELKKELGEIISDAKLVKLTKVLPSEAGFFRFEGELDKEGLIETIASFLEYGATTQKDIDMIAREIRNELKYATIKGTFGIQMSNPKYFTFEGSLYSIYNSQESKEVEIEVSYLENKKEFTVKEPGGNGGHATFEINEGRTNTSFTLYAGETPEENIVIVSGSYSDTNFELEAYDPDNQADSLTIDMNKSGETWSGEIHFTEEWSDTDFTINIEAFLVDTESFVLKFNATEANTEGSFFFDAEYNINRVNSVNIETPAEYKSFDELQEHFENSGI